MKFDIRKCFERVDAFVSKCDIHGFQGAVLGFKNSKKEEKIICGECFNDFIKNCAEINNISGIDSNFVKRHFYLYLCEKEDE